MNSVLELREAHAKAIHDARQIIDTADTEKRELRADESEKVDTLFAEADKLTAKVDTLAKREAVESAEARLKQSERKTRPTLSKSPEEAPDYSSALRSWCLRGRTGSRITGADIDNAARCGIDLSAEEITLNAPRTSKRTALAKATSGSGLELVAWTDFYAGFFEKLKYYGPAIDLVTKHQSDNGNSLPIPVMDDTSNVAEILDEAGTAAEAEATTAKVTLGAWKYSSKEVLVSLELLQDSSFDLEAYIAGSLAARFGRKWNTDITVGAGTTLPFGLCTRATASGVVSGGTAAAPTLTVDDFIDTADALDQAYRNMPGVGYMMSRATLSKVRKLKDSSNRYLFDAGFSGGVTSGAPGTINGYPVYVNPDMPTTGVSKAIVLFGDYSQYMWRQVSGIQFFRLSEYRIRSGQISFLAFARADGNLINTASVVKLASPAS